MSIFPAVARANGVFPSADQVVIDPSDPAHIVLRTTYGLVSTRVGGDPWYWTCEQAVPYSSGFHPAIALAQNGSLVAALSDGMAISPGDGCGWLHPGGAIVGVNVVDVSAEKGNPAQLVAVSAPSGLVPPRFWTSGDNGATWAQTGNDLPSGYLPLSIDVAPSDPNRVYVSAFAPGGAKGALLVSDDHGVSWSPHTVPSANADAGPYLAAIAPDNPDRAFLRLSGAPGHLFVFDAGTGMFFDLLVGLGALRGFALSPAGDKVLVADSVTGLWRASTDTFVFEPVHPIPAKCLVWTDRGVHACGTELSDGFTLGFSADEGSTFEALLHQPCIAGPLLCDAASSVGAACPDVWPSVAMQISAQDCQSPEQGGGGVGGAGTGGHSEGGAPNAGGRSPGGAGQLGGGGAGEPLPPLSNGCQCALAEPADSGVTSHALPPCAHFSTPTRWVFLLLAAIFLVRFRRRSGSSFS